MINMISKRALSWLSVSLILAIGSCKNETTGQEASKDSTDGLWMNRSFLDSVVKIQSAKFAGTGGVAEIYINKNAGTAWILDGMWEPKIYKLRRLSEGYFIYRNKPDSGIAIQVKGPSALARFPGGRIVRLGRPDTSDIIGGTGFMTALRNTTGNILLGGRWKVTFSAGPEISREVVFHRDGSVEGLDHLSKFYEICVSGDCKRYCDEADLVYMSPRKNEPGGYWHAFNRKGNTLTIWKVKSLEWMSDWPDIQPETLWLRLTRVGDEN